MTRAVQGLRWARRCDNPWPKSRARGSKAAGLRYERAVARAVRGGVHNPWFEFEDANGLGYCCPDILFSRLDDLIVLECKLTDTIQAQVQLLGLYIPVIALALGIRPRGIVVTKTLTRNSVGVVTTLREALAHPLPCPVLHWLGRGRFPFE